MTGVDTGRWVRLAQGAGHSVHAGARGSRLAAVAPTNLRAELLQRLLQAVC
jgi:hypothetical protein